MVNLVQKYIIKLISKIKNLRLIKWLGYILSQWSLQRRWNTLFFKNYSSGYLIESLQIKFILMYNDWPEYKNSEKQKSMLRDLIDSSEILLTKLEEEEKLSHLRSDEYNKLQKIFFEKINLYSEDLFY